MARISFQQLENEPAAAFHRFEIYRDLGAHRSLRKAYQVYLAQKATDRPAVRKNHNGAGAQHLPGQWGRDSRSYRWRARGSSFDIDRLLGLKQPSGKTLTR